MKSRFRRIGAPSIALFIAAATLGACSTDGQATEGTSTEPITFQIGHVLPATEPINLAVIEVAERITARTDGAITFEVFPGSELGSGNEMIEQSLIGANVITLADYATVSAFGASSLSFMQSPFLFEDPAALACMSESSFFEDLLAELEAEGSLVTIAPNWYFGQRHLIGPDGYPSPEDLEGVRVRVPPVDAWIDTFDALPTEGVVLEWAEVYTGISQGVVDAAEAPLSTLLGSSLHEVADTVTMTGHFASLLGWFVSDDVWAKLTPDQQQIFREEFYAGGSEATDAVLAAELELVDELTALGVSVVDDVDTAAYRAAVQPFYDKYASIWPAGFINEVDEALASC